MNLEKLKELNLKGNKISKISFEAFQNLPELEDLDISYNKVSKFDFSMFDQVGTLAMFHVNMSHNSLKDLHFSSTEAEYGEHSGLTHFEEFTNKLFIYSD